MVSSELLHLGCGTNYRPDWHNVDAVESVEPDEVVDLDEYPWPWDSETYARIDAEHVFEHLGDVEAALRECARILRPGGELRIVMPMGANAVADPDHERLWTYQTPDFYCGERHWDVDTGLSVVDKDVSTHTHLGGVIGAVERAAWHWHRHRRGLGEWAFTWPSMSGEFEVVFRA